MNCVPYSHIEALNPRSQNVIIFGKRAFKNVTVKMGSSTMIGFLIRGHWDKENTQRRATR